MVNDDEFLHRAVRQCHWDENKNRPSSALYKDTKGVSVDRESGRTDDQVKAVLLCNVPDLLGVAKIIAIKCREEDCLVKAAPVEGNDHHAVILRDEDRVLLHQRQARALSRACSYKEK